MLQLRILFKDLLFCHPGTKPDGQVPYGDPQSADARLSGTLSGFDGDPRLHP